MIKRRRSLKRLNAYLAKSNSLFFIEIHHWVSFSSAFYHLRSSASSADRTSSFFSPVPEIIRGPDLAGWVPLFLDG
jgi:hypothetical protein